MHTRKIAVVGLGDDAVHAFRSMLKIIEGRASAAWELTTPEHADVLMAGAGEPAIERWARTDKPLIAVYEGGTARPASPYTLCHPFRVMQLLGVLDDVARVLDTANENVANAPVHAAEAPVSAWAFAESLRQLARATAQGRLLVAHCGYGSLYVHDDLSAYHANAELLSRLVRQGAALTPLATAADPLPAGLLRRPVFELAWFAGLHGPEGLAPWLDRRAGHRLRRWPDFGLVRGSREQLALAAALSHGAFDVERLAQSSQQPTAQVERFLNACAMTGLLASTQATVPAAEPARAAPAAFSRLGNLIRGLRHRLGLTG